MQREVLNRSVNCGGEVFDAGTPIECVPIDNRESCQRSGWTRFEAVGESDQSDQRDQTDLANQSDQTDQSDLANQTAGQNQTSEQTDQSNPTDQTELANQNQNGGDEPLGETDLEMRVVEILANAVPPITTKAQAREFLAANKTFRIIEGIGKASDAAIRSVIGEAAAE